MKMNCSPLLGIRCSYFGEYISSLPPVCLSVCTCVGYSRCTLVFSSLEPGLQDAEPWGSILSLLDSLSSLLPASSIQRPNTNPSVGKYLT